MVGFLKWACILGILAYLDGPDEQSVGTRIDVSHEAATPPGLTVTAEVELVAVDGRRLTFNVVANDGVEIIARGTHERFVIHRPRFDEKLRNKRNGFLKN